MCVRGGCFLFYPFYLFFVLFTLMANSTDICMYVLLYFVPFLAIRRTPLDTRHTYTRVYKTSHVCAPRKNGFRLQLLRWWKGARVFFRSNISILLPIYSYFFFFFPFSLIFSCYSFISLNKEIRVGIRPAVVPTICIGVSTTSLVVVRCVL